MKLLTISRGCLREERDSSICYFGRNDQWDYKWYRRVFGIKLKPGEKKKILIGEKK